MVSAGHNRVIAHTNELSGCDYIHKSCTRIATQNPAWTGEGLMKTSPQLRSYWQWGAPEDVGRGIRSFRDTVP